MISVQNLRKTYRRHANVVEVLKGIDLVIEKGEFLSVVGASGSGKSTLMHVMGTLDQPDSGMVMLGPRRIDNLRRSEQNRLRNGTFGFIFQFYHLLPELTTLQNVMMPALVGASVFNWGGRKREAIKNATEMLERVGLGHRLHHKPRELSGGEMQRTAIARALVAKPKILFADEPTGNLDTDSGRDIVDLLKSINREQGVTILMVTHNLELVRQTDRVVRMTSGRIGELPVERDVLAEC